MILSIEPSAVPPCFVRCLAFRKYNRRGEAKMPTRRRATTRRALFFYTRTNRPPMMKTAMRVLLLLCLLFMVFSISSEHVQASSLPNEDFRRCSLCGGDSSNQQTISNLDGILIIPAGILDQEEENATTTLLSEPILCSELSIAANDGLISESLCARIQPFVIAFCGCSASEEETATGITQEEDSNQSQNDVTTTSTIPPVLPTTNPASLDDLHENRVFGTAFTQNGYDVATGTDSICWKSSVVTKLYHHLPDASTSLQLPNPLVDGFSFAQQEQTELLDGCMNGAMSLNFGHPILEDEDESSLPIRSETTTIQRLRTHRSYRYNIEIDFDLSFLETDEAEIFTDSGERMIGIKLILCAIGKAGFCTPFVHDRATSDATDSANPNRRLSLAPSSSQSSSLSPDLSLDQHKGDVGDGSGHIDSDWLFLTFDDAESKLKKNVSIPCTLEQAGTYFVIGTTQFFTTAPAAGADSTLSDTRSLHRWDIANALQPIGSRVLTFAEPPVILEVSHAVRIVSYVAIGVSASVIVFLIFQTVKHQQEQVLQLSQYKFLLLFLIAALTATISAFLMEPKNDIYCQISFPIIFICIHLLYSITLGRLWRINAVISPLLVEHIYRKSQRKNRWVIPSIGRFQYFTHPRRLSAMETKKQQQMRRSVTTSQLARKIGLYALPQVILQTLSLTLQPQRLFIKFDEDGNVGQPHCSFEGSGDVQSILNYAFAALIILILILLFMAFSSRKLPSLFNETSVIYSSTLNTIAFVGLASIIVMVTGRGGSITSPDLPYLVWVTGILSITLGSSLKLMIPKLRMIWKGEKIVVSKLVSDHHRQQRDKLQSRNHNHHANVTGIDLSSDQEGRRQSDTEGNGTSWNGSFSCADDTSNTDLTTSVAPRQPDDGLLSLSGRTQVSDTRNDVEDDGNAENRNDLDVAKNLKPLPEAETVATSSFRVPKDLSSAVVTQVAQATVSSDNDKPEVVDLEEGKGTHSPSNRNRATPSDASIVDSTGQLHEGRIKKLQGKQKSYGDLLTMGLRTIQHSLSLRDFSKESRQDAEVKSSQSPATAASTDRRADMQRRRSRVARDLSKEKMPLSPDKTPPRRIALRMIDLQEQLSDMNTRIMSGLRVDPDDWDNLVRIINRLDQIFRENVQFSWHDEPDSAPAVYKSSLATTGLPQETEISRPADGRENKNWQSVRKAPKLSVLARKFKKITDVRDRKFNMITYRDVFIGSDAVDAMIYENLASTREEAVKLGRLFADELRLFDHVLGEKKFEDKYLFYRYVDSEDTDSLGSFPDSTDESNLFELSDVLEHSREVEAKAFMAAVVVSDRKFRMKMYPKCFVGSGKLSSS